MSKHVNHLPFLEIKIEKKMFLMVAAQYLMSDPILTALPESDAGA